MLWFQSAEWVHIVHAVAGSHSSYGCSQWVYGFSPGPCHIPDLRFGHFKSFKVTVSLDGCYSLLLSEKSRNDSLDLAASKMRGC